LSLFSLPPQTPEARIDREGFFAHFSLWAVFDSSGSNPLKPGSQHSVGAENAARHLRLAYLARLRECTYEEGSDSAQFRVSSSKLFESELDRDTNQDNAFRQTGPTFSETRIRDHKWVGLRDMAQAESVQSRTCCFRVTLLVGAM